MSRWSPTEDRSAAGMDRGRCRVGRAKARVLLVLVSVVGCGPPRLPYPESLQSERPEERVAAIKQAAERQDRSVVGILVDRLEDDDEAVRFYAILALEKLTGTRMGYDYHGPEGERWRAVKRWRRWLAQGGAVGGQTSGPRAEAVAETEPSGE